MSEEEIVHGELTKMQRRVLEEVARGSPHVEGYPRIYDFQYDAQEFAAAEELAELGLIIYISGKDGHCQRSIIPGWRLTVSCVRAMQANPYVRRR